LNISIVISENQNQATAERLKITRDGRRLNRWLGIISSGPATCQTSATTPVTRLIWRTVLDAAC
jgi:hypothetical protein